MSLRYLSSIVAGVMLLCSSSVVAEEGMWQLDKFDKDLFKRMESVGLELSQKEIFDPGGSGIAYAVVDLGGGTGSFISPEGLILTNHHVGFTALQRASTNENNYLENGFYAGREGKDIPAEGYQASVLISIKDVTDEVLNAAEGKTGAERFKAIEDKIKLLEMECEKDGDLRCYVSAFYSGM